MGGYQGAADGLDAIIEVLDDRGQVRTMTGLLGAPLPQDEAWKLSEFGARLVLRYDLRGRPETNYFGIPRSSRERARSIWRYR